MAERLTPAAWDCFVAEQQPTDMDLGIAPLIDNWYPIRRRGVLQIFGRVTGHPKHGDGYLTTSEVLRIADDGSWMRTRRHYYRFGKRHVHRTVQEIAEQVMGERTSPPSEPWRPHPGAQCRDYFPDLPLPPFEDEDDTSPRP